MSQRRGLSDAAEWISDGAVGTDDRRIQTSGAEEVHQRCIDVWERAGLCTTGGLQPLTVNGLAGGGGLFGFMLSNECVVVCTFEVRHHQIAANRVGIDGTVQMTSAVEVVGEAECESVAQIALNTDIGLLRVRIHEILPLRIAKGLKSKRQERGWIQVVLIQEDRLREVDGLKALLVRKKSKSRGSGRV